MESENRVVNMTREPPDDSLPITGYPTLAETLVIEDNKYILLNPSSTASPHAITQFS